MVWMTLFFILKSSLMKKLSKEMNSINFNITKNSKIWLKICILMIILICESLNTRKYLVHYAIFNKELFLQRTTIKNNLTQIYLFILILTQIIYFNSNILEDFFLGIGTVVYCSRMSSSCLQGNHSCLSFLS